MMKGPSRGPSFYPLRVGGLGSWGDSGFSWGGLLVLGPQARSHELLHPQR